MFADLAEEAGSSHINVTGLPQFSACSGLSDFIGLPAEDFIGLSLDKLVGRDRLQCMEEKTSP